MDAEICIECENPVERTGEEALYIDGEGPFCEKCFDWRVLEEEHAAIVKELKAEIELLKENYAALKDEFNRGAALAQQHCPKPPLGHSVFEGIPLLAERAEKAEAEIEQLKADIPAYATRAAQERVAIVRFLHEKANDQGYLEIIRVVLKQLIKKIADGEHHVKE